MPNVSLNPLPVKFQIFQHTFSGFVDLSVMFLGVPCITDCVMGELEKMGTKYRVALRFVFPTLNF
jgi:rRNA-processing protein FCF1